MKMEWSNISVVLHLTNKSKILETKLLIYECEGTESEIKELV